MLIAVIVFLLSSAAALQQGVVSAVATDLAMQLGTSHSCPAGLKDGAVCGQKHPMGFLWCYSRSNLTVKKYLKLKGSLFKVTLAFANSMYSFVRQTLVSQNPIVCIA